MSSTETVFKGFEIDWRHNTCLWTGFELFQSLGLLHELLQAPVPLRHGRDSAAGDAGGIEVNLGERLAKGVKTGLKPDLVAS